MIAVDSSYFIYIYKLNVDPISGSYTSGHLISRFQAWRDNGLGVRVPSIIQPQIFTIHYIPLVSKE